MREHRSLGDEIRRLGDSLDRADDALRVFSEWVARHVTATDVVQLEPTAPPGLTVLSSEFVTARSSVAELLDRVCGRPAALLMQGFLLSEEEFYLAKAQRMLPNSFDAGCAAIDPYEAFRMFHCEDRDRRWYVNPDKKPWPPPISVGDGSQRRRVHIRFGTPPEEISWGTLREDQRVFFESRLPEVAARFKRKA